MKEARGGAASHLEAARPGDLMHFHSYAIEKDVTRFKLRLSERWSTDSAGIAKCLKMEAEPKVELEIILKQLESRISAHTLLTTLPPEPAPSIMGLG